VDLDEHARGADNLIGFPVCSENFKACLLGRQASRTRANLDANALDKREIWTATIWTANKSEKPQGLWVFTPNGRF
jgi:hypothetical protein